MSLAIRRMPPGLRLPAGRLAWSVAALLLLLGTATAAYGFWASTTSSSNAAAAADALSPGSKPAVTASGTSLNVSWAGGTTVNGHAATGYTVTRYAASSGGTGTPATGGCAGTVTTLTCTEQNVAGGIWYYTVTPTIALWTGAESPRSTGVSNDPSAPSATASGLSPAANSAGWNNTSPVTFTITADDGAGGSGVASISYTVDGGAQQTVSGSSATVTVSGDGIHTVSYFATDKVGNAGTAQNKTVRIDTLAPAAPAYTAVPAYVNLATVSGVTMSGSAEAAATVTLVASDGAGHSVPMVTTASGTGTWSVNLDLTSLNQGAVTYTATATDAAGNTGPAKTTTSIKDTVKPDPAQGLSVPAYVNMANAAAVPVSGTAEAGASVTVVATDPGAVHSVQGLVTVLADGTWSLSLNLSQLDQGTATYSVTVKDPAGNASSVATTSDTKDTIAPALKIDRPGYINAGNVNSYKISGTNDPGLTVNLAVSDSTTTVPATASGTPWTAAGLNMSGLKETSSVTPIVTITITATTSDAAGNSSTATATVVKDTQLPALNDVTLANGGTAGKADQNDTLTIQFSEQMDASKICSNWNNNPGVQTINGNGEVTVHISTSNVLTVASGSGVCSLNVGSVFLGPNARYGATSALSFGGNGNNASSISWNGTALTIKLGKAVTGASGTTSTKDAPTYNPAPGLSDLAGNLVGTSALPAKTANTF